MGAYICIFTFIFLGVMGAVNAVMLLTSIGTAKIPPVYVRPLSCDDVEGLVRNALSGTRGDVVIVVPKKLSCDEEFMKLCRALCKDHARVSVAARKSYRGIKSTEGRDLYIG